MTSEFKKHIPLHLYFDKGIYFVTSSTIKKERFFNNDFKLSLLKERLEISINKYKIKMYAWVLLANHYHLLFYLGKGISLISFIKFINGGSSYDLNKLEKSQGRKIWWNYWDRCIRGETDFYKRFNYIHRNPVKHGYVKSNSDYNFSSYSYYKNKYGTDFLLDIEERYSILDFTDPNDDFRRNIGV